MSSIKQVVEVLEEALRPGSDLAALIKLAQEIIWSRDPSAPPDTAWAALRDLAHDLDFFVADPKARGEDPAYYGDARARAEIRQALDALGFLL